MFVVTEFVTSGTQCTYFPFECWIRTCNDLSNTSVNASFLCLRWVWTEPLLGTCTNVSTLLLGYQFFVLETKQHWFRVTCFSYVISHVISKGDLSIQNYLFFKKNIFWQQSQFLFLSGTNLQPLCGAIDISFSFQDGASDFFKTIFVSSIFTSIVMTLLCPLLLFYYCCTCFQGNNE